MTLATLLFLGLLAHMVADYVLQSDWMAGQKTTRWVPALVHGAVHGLAFLSLLIATEATWPRVLIGFLAIALTHAAIDHFRIARYVCYAKEYFAPPRWWPHHRYLLSETKTGYGPDKPDWLAFWLLILADNTLHVAINSAVLAWLWHAA